MALKNVARLRTTCPICHKPDWCMISEDYKLVLCRRVESEHPNAKGGWYHSLQGNIRYDKSKITSTQLKERAPANITHAVYSKLINQLDLSEKHFIHLRDERKFSHREIFLSDLRSFEETTNIERIILSLKKAFPERVLLATPGFFIENSTLKFVTELGFVIPVKDSYGHIEALQVRLDNPTAKAKYKLISSANKVEGTSSSAPLHVAYPVSFRTRKELIVTEGALKANVVAQRLNIVALGLAGVDNQQTLLQTVYDLQQHLQIDKFERIIIAFDADYKTNEFVRLAYEKAVKTLLDVSHEVAQATWSIEQGKGIDDVLIKGFSVNIKQVNLQGGFI